MNHPKLSSSSAPVLYLTTEKELRTYMHPLRQKILRTLRLHPDGMTAKQLADLLSIAPSSAGHHLAALEQIGVVIMARTEQIHGFTAKFYQAADIIVSLGQAGPGTESIQDTLLRHGVQQVLEHYLEHTFPQKAAAKEAFGSDVFFGIWYATPEETRQFMRSIQSFLEAHQKPGPDTVPFELALAAHVPEEHL